MRNVMILHFQLLDLGLGKIKVMITDQKRVLRDYPNAKLTTDYFGNYIVTDDEHVLAEDYFLPPAISKEIAWEHAALACKTTQNFNRTHPARMDLHGIEAKLNRINRRKKRARYVKKN